jgi:hypothetical protein
MFGNKNNIIAATVILEPSQLNQQWISGGCGGSGSLVACASSVHPSPILGNLFLDLNIVRETALAFGNCWGIFKANMY